MQKTEVAITLMKTVLDNVSYEHIGMPVTLTDLSSHRQPEPLKNLNELAKAQLMFYATAAEALSTVQGEIEELSVAAEGEYRCVHSLLHLHDPRYSHPWLSLHRKSRDH